MQHPFLINDFSTGVATISSYGDGSGFDLLALSFRTAFLGVQGTP